MPKYSNIEVDLIGQDGNAFAILARVKKVLKANGVSKKEIDAFMEEAMSGDYNHLLSTVMKTVTIAEFYGEDEDDYDDY
jgi:hypothetical protein